MPTPGSVADRFDILSPGDIVDMEVGTGGKVVAVVREPDTARARGAQNALYFSNNYGIEWHDSAFYILSDYWGNNEIYNIAIAPDNPNVWAMTVGYSLDVPNYSPQHVYYTDDGGQSWVDTNIELLSDNESIRDIDISTTYNGTRDIGVATVTGTGNGSFYITNSRTWGSWFNQSSGQSILPVTQGTADYFNIRFSPTYPTDLSVALVYATDNATYYNVGFRDTSINSTLNYAFNDRGVEVKNNSSPTLASPSLSQLFASDIELPSDFTGQSSTLRRAYISLDSDTNKATTCQDGIFRIDDTHVYMLMDTTKTLDKSIYSIAYNGTVASGKLLAGEHHGFPCTATVPTWFTDSPTVCPIPCWYPALKPPTGAAAQGTCTSAKDGVGSSIVKWSDDGTLAFAGTGALSPLLGIDWYWGLIGTPVANDESAFSISRNNGETWNQLGLIDTTIDWFNDVAPTLDCTTVYLASSNHNVGTSCNEFDSVWRTTMNPNISNPLPVSSPIGFYWERVLTRPTSTGCNTPQSDLPLLRLPEFCDDDPIDGQIVAWAAQGTGVMMWSSDYGDFWSIINPRDTIQDFTFETHDIIYVLSPTGLVQRLNYSGTEWNTKSKSYDSKVVSAHTIAAFYKGKVLVGSAGRQDNLGSFSPSEGKQWITIPASVPNFGNVHVAFDIDFANNSFVYMGDDKLLAGTTSNDLTGTLYREQAPAYIKMEDVDMMSPGNSAHAAVDWPFPFPDPPHRVGQFGIVAAKTGDPEPALYTAHAPITTTQSTAISPIVNSAVCRTIRPWQAIPKYGIAWDCLDIFSPRVTGVRFTLEPSSLKYCGCCTMDTYTTLWAIDDVHDGAYDEDGYSPDNNQGMLWAYTDCLAKKGPVILVPQDGAFVGCDPVTGRNQQIDLSWEQLCLAVRYQIQIYKDRAMTMKVDPAQSVVGGQPMIVAPTGSLDIQLDNINVTSPAVWISPGALPEAGANYFWRVRVIRSSTGQIATSPWSALYEFSIKPGFQVTTPVEGIGLLSPVNGCKGCAVHPTSLSWTPYKEATKYELMLAKDPEFKQIIKKATTTTTAYEYKDPLDYEKSYYWRVRSTEINGKSNVSDWSATFSFTTESAPVAPEKPSKDTTNGPVYIWWIILVVVAVPIAMLALIIMTRKS